MRSSIVTTGPRGNPTLKAEEVISRPSGVWGEMVWDLSRWDDPFGDVTLNGDRDVDLMQALKNTVKFLLEQGRAALTRNAPSAPRSRRKPAQG
jgi:hypothetical protein